MKMKKLVGTTLAGVMALSLAVPAFAADDPEPTVKPVAETTESQFSIDLEGLIYTPTIRVQVSDSGSVYVNPAKGVVAGTMAKALDGTANLDYSFADQGVISTPILIRSDTDQKLSVSVTGTASVPKTSKVVIVDKLTTTNPTAPEVTLTINGNGDAGLGTSAALATTTADDGTKTIGLDENKLEGTAVKMTPADGGKSATVTKTGKVAMIEKATQKVVDGKVTGVTPQYGVVVVQGTATDPSKITWSETDIVNVNVSLTFGIESDT